MTMDAVPGPGPLLAARVPVAGAAMPVAGLPQIIQGGMGVGISGWPLARAVAQAGQLGVVSGTALARWSRFRPGPGPSEFPRSPTPDARPTSPRSPR